MRELKEMLEAKSNFGHCSSKLELFIAGGSSGACSAISTVESYDIKKNAWKHLPKLS